jgi:predicted Zn-dependent protease
MRGRRRTALVAALACLLTAACQTRPEPRTASAEAPASPPASDPLMARYALEQGRALLREGRSESAVRVLRRGLAQAPEDAALHRALARALEAQGHPGDAEAAWARANALDPPQAPLPLQPLPGAGAGVLIALVPAESAAPERAAATWPEP